MCVPLRMCGLDSPLAALIVPGADSTARLQRARAATVCVQATFLSTSWRCDAQRAPCCCCNPQLVLPSFQSPPCASLSSSTALLACGRQRCYRVLPPAAAAASFFSSCRTRIPSDNQEPFRDPLLPIGSLPVTSSITSPAHSRYTTLPCHQQHAKGGAAVPQPDSACDKFKDANKLGSVGG